MFTYIFFVNDNDLNKKTMNATCFLNIKLKELRNILKTILQDIRAINLNENKFIV